MYITWVMSLACSTIHTTNPEESGARAPTQENRSNAKQARKWLRSRGAHMGAFRRWNGSVLLSEDGGNRVTPQSRFGP